MDGWLEVGGGGRRRRRTGIVLGMQMRMHLDRVLESCHGGTASEWDQEVRCCRKETGDRFAIRDGRREDQTGKIQKSAAAAGLGWTAGANDGSFDHPKVTPVIAPPTVFNTS